MNFFRAFAIVPGFCSAFWLVVAPALAHAQSTPAPDLTQTPSPPAIAGDPVPRPPLPSAAAAESGPDLGALSARIDQAEQDARIASRKVEILEEQLAAQKTKATATLAADDNGFSQRSADGSYVLKVAGILQADSRWFLGDGALSDKADTFLIRRMRPSLAGTLFGVVDFRFVPDFAGGAAAVLDAYVDAHPAPWARLRVGKFKPPIGLERLQQDADLPLLERALTQYLTPQRDVGASLWGEVLGGRVTYNIGIFNGAADAANPDLDTDHAKDFAFRLLLQPFKAVALEELGSLGLHFAVTTGNRLGTPSSSQLPAFRSGGLNTFFSYLAAPAAATDPAVFANRRETRLNPGLFYYLGPFGLLAEYVQAEQEVVKGVFAAGTTASPANRVTSASVATLTHRAAHVTVSVVVGGKNGFDGATPTHRLDLSKGTLGALEISGRWNYLRVDDDTFGNPGDATVPTFADRTKSASRAQGWAVGLTYVPARTVRFAANFEHTWFKDGAGTRDKPIDRNAENVLITRAQVNF